LREIIIHAGAYKTATSSIQLLCNRHSDLLSKAGLLFPKTGFRPNAGSAAPDSGAHHQLVHLVKFPQAGSSIQIALLRDRLRREIAGSSCNRILLSSELLTATTLDVKRGFFDQFCAIPEIGSIRVKYAIRAPDDYLESISNQSIKFGRFPRISRRPIPFPQDIADWKSLVGDNVDVSYFSKRSADAFIRRFFDTLGVPLNGVDTNVNDNQATSLKGYWIRQIAFHFARERGLIGDRVSRARFFSILDELDRSIVSERLVILSPLERLAILREANGEMRGLAESLSSEERKLLLAELDPERLADAPPKNVNREPALTIDEVLAVMRVSVDRLQGGRVAGAPQQAPSHSTRRHRSVTAGGRRRGQKTTDVFSKGLRWLCRKFTRL
jgi:hypothetical protein